MSLSLSFVAASLHKGQSGITLMRFACYPMPLLLQEFLFVATVSVTKVLITSSCYGECCYSDKHCLFPQKCGSFLYGGVLITGLHCICLSLSLHSCSSKGTGTHTLRRQAPLPVLDVFALILLHAGLAQGNAYFPLKTPDNNMLNCFAMHNVV